MNETDEQWRWIHDRNNEQTRYQISSQGRVRSQQPGFEGRILKGGEGHDSPTAGPRNVWLNNVKHPQSRPHSVTMLVAGEFLGPSPHPGATPVHINGQAWDNRAENLAWASPPSPIPILGGLSFEQIQAREQNAWEAVHKATRDAVEATRHRATMEAAIKAQTATQPATEA